MMTRRTRTSILAATLAALVSGSPAAAAAPLHFTFEVDQTVYAPGLSSACGFDVYVTTEGTAHALLFLEADGTAVARELDFNAGWTLTFSAPSLGTSYSQVGAGPLIATYPEGTDIGDPATVTISGVSRKIGDDPAEAGRLVFNAVVVFVEPTFGIPIFSLLDAVSATGHFLGDATTRRCEALASA